MIGMTPAGLPAAGASCGPGRSFDPHALADWIGIFRWASALDDERADDGLPARRRARVAQVGLAATGQQVVDGVGDPPHDAGEDHERDAVPTRTR